jgi:translocation and assembly module TamB
LLPRISLYADPDLPEAEKLAWLVLGRPGSAGGTEAALLQQAALALITNHNAQNRQSLASSFGLGEIRLRGSAT